MHTVLKWWRKDTVVTQGQCISSEPISENKNLVQSKKKKKKTTYKIVRWFCN